MMSQRWAAAGPVSCKGTRTVPAMTESPAPGVPTKDLHASEEWPPAGAAGMPPGCFPGLNDNFLSKCHGREPVAIYYGVEGIQ